MTHTPADAALWRAQLADMPIEVIVAFLRERGYTLARHKPGYVIWSERIEDAIARVGRLDALPPGYPPLADADEALPFDGEDRRT